jgi:hypothetical protein
VAWSVVFRAAKSTTSYSMTSSVAQEARRQRLPSCLAVMRARRQRPSGCAAKRDNEFSPTNVDCHATLRWGSCLCNGGTIPRFARAVCGYVVRGDQSITAEILMSAVRPLTLQDSPSMRTSRLGSSVPGADICTCSKFGKIPRQRERASVDDKGQDWANIARDEPSQFVGTRASGILMPISR